MYRLPLYKRLLVLNLMVEGSSMRAISRIVGVSINTVSKLLADAGPVCAAHHDQTVRRVPARRVECDEIWSFCYAKQRTVNQFLIVPQGVGDIWTWTAVDVDTKLVLSYWVGDRSQEDGLAFLEDLRSRLTHPVHIATDGYQVYLSAVEEVFGEDARHLLRTEGESTSYVERQNLTMRQSMRRFTRKTNGFSKRLERHVNMLALYFLYYNFVRIHSSLKATPAQVAGLTDQAYSLDWLADLIEEAQPRPNRPANYRPRNSN